MSFLDFILYASLLVFVLYITRINNMWGVSQGTKKAKEDVKREKDLQKKRLRYLWFLGKAEWFADNVGFKVSDYREKVYKFKIDRVRWQVKVLDRTLKPKELVGIMRMITLFFCFIGALGFVLTGSIFFVVFGLTLFLPSLFGFYADAVIEMEDNQLERDFPDLYLLLYSRLVKGSHTRIAPTLTDYMASLDAMEGGKSKKVIRNFVSDLRSNIEIYGDDGIAIMKLRDKYTSVMIVNFTNLAVQALNGVDNSDKLLQFKIELNQKRIEQMKQRADKLVARGRRAIYVVYIILFQFVLLSWFAKLNLAGGLRSLMGW